VAAGFNMKIHPHMLRHACGFKLANEGIDTRTISACRCFGCLPGPAILLAGNDGGVVSPICPDQFTPVLDWWLRSL
jgi:hypothetical protein